MSEENDQVTKSWMDGLQSEELKGSEALKQFNDIDGLAKGYSDLKAYQGQSIRMPGEDASDDARKEFYDKLAAVDGVMLRPNIDTPEQSAEFYRSMGAPESPDGYEYVAPEGVTLDQDIVTKYSELAVNAGITKNQFKNMMDGILKSTSEQTEQMSDAVKAEVDSLRVEWGMAYDQNMLIAAATARSTGAPQLVVDSLLDGSAGADATKWIYELSKKFSSEGLNLGQHDGIEHKATPDEIRATIDEIMNNEQHPYWVAGHPQHSQAVDKMLDLNRQLYPG